MRARVSAVFGIGFVALLLSVGPAEAAGTTWLCNPSLASDPCRPDLTTSEVDADSSVQVRRYKLARKPPIDCFYVYPTVSEEVTPNASFAITPALQFIAEMQAAPLSRVCRVFAPVYRQITLPGSELYYPLLTGPAEEIALGDVIAAWHDYLAQSHGRGVVIVGHSQGSQLAVRLLQEEIERDRAARRRVISAVMPGANAVVRKGRGIGGNFRRFPVCSEAGQIHCVVAWSSYRGAPAEDSAFGHPGSRAARLGIPRDQLAVICTSPAALDGRRGNGLEVEQPSRPVPGLLGLGIPAPPEFATPRESFPGIFSGGCRQAHGANWLNVSRPRDDRSPQPYADQSFDNSAGLHLYDLNLVMGNLVRMVRLQGEAYLQR